MISVKNTLIVILLAVPCFLSAQDSLRIIDAVAADVGGKHITIAEIMDYAKNIMQEKGAPKTEAAFREQLNSAYGEALTNLIVRQLILIRYDQAKQKLPDWVFNRRVESVVEEHFGGDRSQLVSMLNKRGISYAKWKKKIEEDTIITAMRQQFVDQNIVIRLEDIKNVYDTSYATNKLSGTTRLGMILLRPNEKQTAEDAIANAKTLVEKLRSGQDFAATARKVSLEGHASKGGDWGYINPEDELRKELVEALAALKPGHISDPVVIAADYVYILKKIDESTDLSVSFESVRDEIERNLRADAGAARFDAWIDSLKQSTTIRVYKPTP